MSDAHHVDPKGWEYDLQSVYSAYMGYFQLHDVPWYDRPWGHLFESFDQFLAFSWPAITVTDTRTGRAHIVTRLSSLSAFLKMIQSRYGDTLHEVDNMLLIVPSETTPRPLWHVNDKSSYTKLHLTLPRVALDALKARVRTGDPTAIKRLWNAQDKIFLGVAMGVGDVRLGCVEWGYAAIRSAHLVAAGAWPPVPDTNYRKGHYIISEHVDKPSSSVSWQYAFGSSQVIPKAKMPRIIQSVLSLTSPESETVANDLVLVGHGIQVILQRLDDMKIKLPANVLTLDIAYLERALYTSGARGPMYDRKTGAARAQTSLLSLGGILRSYSVATECVLGNAGNDAVMGMVGFQRMVGEKAVVVGAENGSGNAAGNKNGDRNENEHAHGKIKEGPVKRATTVAGRFLRPLGPQPDATHLHAKNGHARVGSVDELGKMKTRTVKRASMFSTLRAPSVVSTDKDKPRESTSGSGSGTRKSASAIGWLVAVKGGQTVSKRP